MSRMTRVGWDIGGAHLKAVVYRPHRQTAAVFQRPCPLWQGLDTLRTAAGYILQQLPAGPCRHALTMTGELVDLFAHRDAGVAAIIDTMTGLLGHRNIWLFAGPFGLVPVAAITRSHYPAIASSNWLASAGFAATKLKDGLFVDIGSTTTDIVLMAGGKTNAHGLTDYQRLLSQELVYTGIVRTAVMAVAQTVQDEGQTIGLMAEQFATMADAYRLTGDLNEAHDLSPTADGGEKTIAASARRLARMVGCDFVPEALPRWQRLAENLRSQQLQKIERSCRWVAQSGECRTAPVVGAGIGRFLAREMARNMDRPYLDFNELTADCASTGPVNMADCAPAAALALWPLTINGENSSCISIF